MRAYEKSHPWITFSIDLGRASQRVWIALGEAQSKCEHVAGIPLRPDTAEELHKLYLAKGVMATTAIEGNTLSEDEVLRHLNGKLELPPSREYQKKEIENIVAAFNEILGAIKKGVSVPLSVDFVGKLNELVLRNLKVGENVLPGKIRKDSRVVGRYFCAPADDCEYLLKAFCEWMSGPTFEPKQGDEIIVGVIKAIIAHIYFVWIHPYGDGNGRTARLLELKFLMEAGVPSDAAHLLSNHYNLTRADYYRHLDNASKSQDILPFIEYAVKGFVEQLREQIEVIRDQHIHVTWINYVHDRFRGDKSNSGRRRRALVLAVSDSEKSVQKNEIPRLTVELAAEYAKKTPKTVSRDLNALENMDLIMRTPEGYVVRKNKILAFLPVRKRSSRLRRSKTKLKPRRMLDTRQLPLL